jgi:hypothetical protein
MLNNRTGGRRGGKHGRVERRHKGEGVQCVVPDIRNQTFGVILGQ